MFYVKKNCTSQPCNCCTHDICVCSLIPLPVSVYDSDSDDQLHILDTIPEEGNGPRVSGTMHFSQEHRVAAVRAAIAVVVVVIVFCWWWWWWLGWWQCYGDGASGVGSGCSVVVVLFVAFVAVVVITLSSI